MYRNEIKSYIVRAGMTMSEVVDYLADEYEWSSFVSTIILSLQQESVPPARREWQDAQRDRTEKRQTHGKAMGLPFCDGTGGAAGRGV